MKYKEIIENKKDVLIDDIEKFIQTKSYGEIINLITKKKQKENINNKNNIPTTIKPGSPISNAGIIYKFNRGVLGIHQDGTLNEIILDNTNRHHSDATIEIGLINNCEVNEYDGPFESALNLANQGLTIIQLEGNSILIYLPNRLTKIQVERITEELIPRFNFEIAFTYNDKIYSNVNIIDFLIICQNLTVKISKLK